ncbi:hypothetical protein, partial [Vibrio vulnificus]|uniref:hypothetical protein n=1 Tax=Vibrio vulnificus TaxID=672 RepID=UPI0040589CF0
WVSKFSMPKLFFSPIIIAFYHFRNPQLSPSVKDLIVTQEFSSKKSLTSCEGLLYKRQAKTAGFYIKAND